ncbi:unnamed protein product [Toxocara canis]|uniref:Glutathione peroxidase n=1 Tax=Toxocara canis TaxID=6265 RepID=A0A183V8T5_TOXCA|nr:unnamed protein product [Toxocara canis]
MPRPKKIQKLACEGPNETNKRKQAVSTNQTESPKKARKGAQPVAELGSAGRASQEQERKITEAADVVPRSKTEKGVKTAEAAGAKMGDQELAVSEGKRKKGAGKAALKEPAVMQQEAEENAKMPAALAKENSQETTGPEEHAPVKESEGAKVAEKRVTKGRKAAGRKKQADGEAIPPKQQVVGASQVGQRGTKKTGKGKKVNEDVAVQEVEVPMKEEKVLIPFGVREEEINPNKNPEEQQKVTRARRKNPKKGGKDSGANEEPNETAEAPAANESKAKKAAKTTTAKTQAKASSSEGQQPSSTIYDFTVKDADGNEICLAKYKGRPVLIVNVASRCGHTKKNYTQLKELYDKYQQRGLCIAAFPCNQFGGQEPGAAADVKKQIAEKYGFEPDFYDKITVNGNNAEPLYKFLKKEQGNNEPIKWNFAKFLIDDHGFVVGGLTYFSDLNSQRLLMGAC